MFRPGRIPPAPERARRRRSLTVTILIPVRDAAATLAEALATSGPVVIEAIVDPNEPPMPPKVSMRQAKHFAESLVRGTPNARKIALTVLGDRIRELV